MKLPCPFCRVVIDVPAERVIVECHCGAVLFAKPRLFGRELVEKQR